MLGLRQPTSGTVEVEGVDITRADDDQLREVKRRYGVAFQHGALFRSLTVGENIALPVAEAMDLDEESLAALVALRLRMVGLPLETATKYPGPAVRRHDQAHGARPRPGARPGAAVPRRADRRPRSRSRPRRFDALVLYLRDTLRLTVVMVTHDLDTLARTCDRVAVLVDGKVIVDTLEGIVANDHPWIRQYFHGARGRAA